MLLYHTMLALFLLRTIYSQVAVPDPAGRDSLKHETDNCQNDTSRALDYVSC
jgi:hypothetical protein